MIMAEKNIQLIIEYDGSNYSGWQSQQNAQTVQDTVEYAIYQTTGIQLKTIAAGRTDAGVHAFGQSANFKIDHTIDPEKYKDALNHYLPEDIRILKSQEVADDFNSRFDARSKIYRYRIGFDKSALLYKYRWEYEEDIDLTKLTESAKFIIGEFDFAPFCVVASRKENNVCKICESNWQISETEAIYEVKGERFLHSMVRSLVGAMINLARIKKDKNKQNLTLESFKDIIQSSTEERIVYTAPAHGLYLVSVQYEKD